MNKSIPVLGFLILAFMAVFVFGAAALEAWKSQPMIAIVLSVALVGLLYQLYQEAQTLGNVKVAPFFGQKNMMNLAAVVIGALISYTLATTMKLGVVLGAGLVGLVAGLVLPAYGVPLYTGAFAGMASAKLLGNHFELALAGIVAGIVFVLATGVYDGFGGKLGTISASGCLFTGICLAGEFAHPAVPQWNVGILLVITGIISAVAAYFISVNMKRGPVLGSSIVGVIAGLLLPQLVPNVGTTLAVMAILASFAGMSSAKRFPSIVPLFVIGAVAALVYMFSNPYIGGVGGKLGTIAFGSGMAVHGVIDLVSRVGAKQKQEA